MASKIEINALINKQWLAEWDQVEFNETSRKKPEPHFYIFNIKAKWLKQLSKVYPRIADKTQKGDLGIQRKHDPNRSEDIKKYISNGFPLADFSKNNIQKPELAHLKMPGWLPTAIIANILAPNTIRGLHALSEKDSIKITSIDNGSCKIVLPENFEETKWDPNIPPIEIIDGQHRLWAFDFDDNLDGEFDLPVVAFYNLDITWQAYLFYTINIKPKKINASLAFDLYPILRVQKWLSESSEGNKVYKETRAQEMTEVLWSYPESPWYGRINMLGESNSGDVTQAAFIRSLLASYIKSTKGLYASPIKENEPLVWNRPQQAAFLILIWSEISNAIERTENDWAIKIRKAVSDKKPQIALYEDALKRHDPAFSSKYSLLATDQGVRGYLQVTNDICFALADKYNLNSFTWEQELREDYIDFADIDKAYKSFENSPVREIIVEISTQLSNFDWRTSSTPGLDDSSRQKQLIYRGSSGYKEIRKQLLRELMKSQNPLISETATNIFSHIK